MTLFVYATPHNHSVVMFKTEKDIIVFYDPQHLSKTVNVINITDKIKLGATSILTSDSRKSTCSILDAYEEWVEIGTDIGECTGYVLVYMTEQCMNRIKKNKIL
jgi:hypothetical protein